MDTTYILDNFVQTKIGEPYRLFPFGTVVKNGKRREITPEYAARFSLPHFSPPIKLGSHEDTTPAGGHIKALEVRADGLYAVPEWNEKGEQAMKDGAYKYHSPEVLWEDGALENPDNGAMINGPLILGCALLHTPHLGEKAALYTVELITEEKNMNENVNIPTSLWDKFIAPLLAREPEKVEVVKTVEPEDYTATKLERDELKAKFAEQEAEVKAKEVKAAIVADLQNKDNFGMTYIALEAAQEAADVMAGMSPEQREWCMRNFKAFIAQIKESNLTAELGTEGQGTTTSDDPKAAFNAIVLGIVDSKKINYNAAMEEAKVSHKDLFLAWAKK